MIVTLSEQTKAHIKTLRLSPNTYSFTTRELTRAYKREIVKAHPENGGSDSKLQIVKFAYDTLKYIANDITPVSKYQTCPVCEGNKLMIMNNNSKKIPCPDCDTFLNSKNEIGPSGKQSIKCKACNGDGVYKLKNGRFVQCKNCDGIGKFIFKCKSCKGTKYISDPTQPPAVTPCRNCNGSGKIVI